MKWELLTIKNEIYFNDVSMKEKIDGLENNFKSPNKKITKLNENGKENMENEFLEIECSK